MAMNRRVQQELKKNSITINWNLKYRTLYVLLSLINCVLHILCGLPWWLSGKKNWPANEGDMGFIPGLASPPGEGNGNPF